MEISDESAEIVLFLETLEHLNFHPMKVVKELSRLVKRKGFLIITTPNLLTVGMLWKFILRRSIHQDISQPYAVGTHYRCYSIREVMYLVKAAGLDRWRYRHIDFPPHYLGGFKRLAQWIITLLIRPWSNNLIVIGRKV